MNARHIGKNLRVGYVTAAMLISVIIAAAAHSPVAGALGLPDILRVDLPIGETALEPVISPLTDTTNKILPVDITSTPSTLGAQVTLPVLGASDQPASVSAGLDIPIVPQVVNAATDAITPLSSSPTGQSRSPSLRTSPLQNVAPVAPAQDGTDQTSPQEGISTASTTRESRSAASSTTAKNTPMPLSPVILGVANFFGSGIPGGVQTLIDVNNDRPVNFTPIIISLIIFVATLAALFGAVYIIDHTTVIHSGNGRLSQFAQAHDVAQIASVAIVSAGAVLVVLFLVMKPF